YFVSVSDGCLTRKLSVSLWFRIYRETLSRFSCAASVEKYIPFIQIKSKRWLALCSYKVLNEAKTSLLQNGKDSTFLHNDTPPTIIKE
ncbi:hypothetical protein ACT7CZ_08535, partial [Bacillus cereus]